MYIVPFLGVSLLVGILSSYVVGTRLPSQVSITRTQSFDAPNHMMWSTITSVEDYPLWKPGVASVTVLSSGDNGTITKWRETMADGSDVTYEVTDNTPKTLFELRSVSDNDTQSGIWIYQLNQNNNNTVITLKRFVYLRQPLRRFIYRWIDADNTDADRQLFNLRPYVSQLIRDNQDMLGITPPLK